MMTAEEIAALLKGANITVNGDFVASKHVEYEVGNVEAGGIGIQINGNDKPAKATESTPTLRTPKKPETKLVKSVFTYRHVETLGCRIAMLHQYLLKVKWIDKDTDMEQFCALFSGGDCDYNVKWTGKQSQLYYLIKVLIDKGYISYPQGVGQWVIVQSHFVDKDSRVFKSFNKQKNPKKTADQIEQMAEILNSARNIDPRRFAEALNSIVPIDEDDED